MMEVKIYANGHLQGMEKNEREKIQLWCENQELQSSAHKKKWHTYAIRWSGGEIQYCPSYQSCHMEMNEENVHKWRLWYMVYQFSYQEIRITKSFQI